MRRHTKGYTKKRHIKKKYIKEGVERVYTKESHMGEKCIKKKHT